MKEMYGDYEQSNTSTAPECHNKNPENLEYIKMGYFTKEDYEANMRRKSNRKKSSAE